MNYIKTNCEYYFEEGHLYYIALEDKLLIYRVSKRGTKYLRFYLVRVISKNKYYDFNSSNYQHTVNILKDMFNEHKVEIETDEDNFREHINIFIEGFMYHLTACHETYDNDPFINNWLTIGGK